MTTVLRKPKTLRSTAALKSKAQHECPLVLIVDDHEDTRLLLRYVLESHACRVIEAADGGEAIRLAKSMLPDLILMDTVLPRVDGLTATRCIRQIARLSDVPIIFVSGRAEPRFRAAALATGGDEYFVKPISLDELETAIARQLQRTRNSKGAAGNKVFSGAD